MGPYDADKREGVLGKQTSDKMKASRDKPTESPMPNAGIAPVQQELLLAQANAFLGAGNRLRRK